MRDDPSYEDMIEEIDDAERQLTTWEIDFVENVRECLASVAPLSGAQQEKLREIWIDIHEGRRG